MIAEEEITDPIDPIPEPKWVTEYTNQIIEKFGKSEEINISTGISLSGPVHVGHLREFMIGAIVCNSLRAKGYNSTLLAFADDMDPLKRRYDFLPENYEQYIGVPLYLIPSHLKKDCSYSDFFLDEFLDSLNKLGIHPKTIRSSEIYNSGVYAETIKHVMHDRSQLQDILRSVSGSKKEGTWPFKFVCTDCHCSTKTEVLQYDETKGDAKIHCGKCDHTSETNIASNGGKLMWRFDWPVRWATFNIHVEPVAHDHASRGGSYDSSEAILSKYFCKEAPVPLRYSWVKNKNSTELHTKTGVVSIKQLVETYPAAVIWSMYALADPKNSILFDLEGSLKEEVRKYVTNSEILKNIIPEEVTLSSVFDKLDIGTIVDFIKMDRPLRDISENDYEAIKKWAQTVTKQPTYELSEDENRLVKEMGSQLANIEEWTAESIKKAIVDHSEKKGITTREASLALYKALFATNTGPNLAQYFAELPREEVLRKLASN